MGSDRSRTTPSRSARRRSRDASDRRISTTDTDDTPNSPSSSRILRRAELRRRSADLLVWRRGAYAAQAKEGATTQLPFFSDRAVGWGGRRKRVPVPGVLATVTRRRASREALHDVERGPSRCVELAGAKGANAWAGRRRRSLSGVGHPRRTRQSWGAAVTARSVWRSALSIRFCRTWRTRSDRSGRWGRGIMPGGVTSWPARWGCRVRARHRP
jgi:hypothetical protein